MVPKDLKVGDTFLDGNLRFVVCKVLANGNYECEVVKNVPEKTKETAVRKKRSAKYCKRPPIMAGAFYHICGGVTPQE